MGQQIRHFFHFLPSTVYWLLGLLCGSFLCFFLRPVSSHLSYNHFLIPSSFFGIIVSAFLPVLLAIVFSHFQLHLFFNAVLFTNGLLHGYCSLLLCIISGHGGWFISVFSLFSQSCCSALLVAFSSVIVHSKRHYRFQTYFVFLVSSFICCLLDYCLISCFRFY